jgi:hypothetical protein
MNKKTLGLGLAALLIFGAVLAVNADEIGEKAMRLSKSQRHSGMGAMLSAQNTAELGLPDDATRQEVMEALWQRRLSELGLTGDSTVSQYHELMRERIQESQNQRDDMLREKLGLPGDATEDEIRDAMRQKTGEKQCGRHKMTGAECEECPYMGFKRQRHQIKGKP